MQQELIDPEGSLVVPGPWGDVQLAHPRWTPNTWYALDEVTQRHVYMCHASLPYFFHHIVLPQESEAESKPWPEVLPAFMANALFTAQAMTPHASALVAAGRLASLLPEYQLCYLEPMGHFKTTMFAVGLPLWLIARDPSVVILMASPKVDFASDRVGRVVGHIEANERFIEMFGYLRPDKPLPGDSWTTEKATVERPKRRANPTLRAFGLTSDVVGVRADVAIVDDAVTKLNITTEKSRFEVFDFITNTVHARLDADNRVMFVIGTSYHADDAYQRIEALAQSTGTWRFVRKPAVLNTDEVPWPPPPPDGRTEWRAGDEARMDFSRTKVLWPEFWSAPKLFIDWLKSPNAFWAERQNQPLDPSSRLFPLEVLRDRCRADGQAASDGSFRPRLRRWSLGVGRPTSAVHWLWQQYADQGFDLTGAQVLLSVDATAGGTGKRVERRDYNVLELWVLFPDGRRVLVALWRRQGDPVKILKPTLKEWLHAFTPDKVLFESNVFQHLVATDWEQQFGVPFTKQPMPPNKAEYLQGMADVIDAGLLYYVGAESDCRQMVKPFEQEMDEYTPGGSRGSHDDTLTAALHVHLYARPDVLTVRRPARVRAVDTFGVDADAAAQRLREMNPVEKLSLLERRLRELKQALNPV